MTLINCKIHLELNWIEDCVLSRAGNSAKFKIMDDKLHVPRVTLSTKDNVNLKKQVSDVFKRSVNQNSCQAIPAKVIEKGKNIYELLRESFQCDKRIFVLAYFVAANDANNEADIKNNRKYFLRKGEIQNYNVVIDGIDFYDQPR